MATIYIVPIEPIDQRYTKQWYDNIPAILRDEIARTAAEYEVVTIDGVSIPPNTSTGAFLNFGATNIYKASQTQRVSELFSQGKIQAGDKFLVTDAWNFIITPIRYMSDLLDIPVEIHGIWHAGAYDPTDILGYKMQKPWPWHVEQSWFYSCDFNYYASQFHLDMFLRNLDIKPEFHHRAVRSGQPHTPIIEHCERYLGLPKRKSVIWPHRYNADKQPEIAERLAEASGLPMVITQNLNLNKDEYYQELASNQVIFSCALHENLGISVMEAVLTGTIPVLPDRCSYAEMYLPEFKYPSAWTESYEAYLQHEDQLIALIQERIDYPERFQAALAQQCEILKRDYLSPGVMVKNLLL